MSAGVPYIFVALGKFYAVNIMSVGVPYIFLQLGTFYGDFVQPELVVFLLSPPTQLEGPVARTPPLLQVFCRALLLLHRLLLITLLSSFRSSSSSVNRLALDSRQLRIMHFFTHVSGVYDGCCIWWMLYVMDVLYDGCCM